MYARLRRNSPALRKALAKSIASEHLSCQTICSMSEFMPIVTSPVNRGKAFRRIMVLPFAVKTS